MVNLITAYDLLNEHQAWGNYEEAVRLGCFPSEQQLIDQVKLGSPLGMALVEAVRNGETIELDVMRAPVREAPELMAVIRWKLDLDRKELDAATAQAIAEPNARRL